MKNRFYIFSACLLSLMIAPSFAAPVPPCDVLNFNSFSNAKMSLQDLFQRLDSVAEGENDNNVRSDISSFSNWYLAQLKQGKIANTDNVELSCQNMENSIALVEFKNLTHTLASPPSVRIQSNVIQPSCLWQGKDCNIVHGCTDFEHCPSNN